MEDLDTNERIFLKTKGLLAHSRRWFRFVFCYRLRYYIGSIVYASPTLLKWVKRIVGYTSVNRNSAFWDSELAGPKAWYLGGTLSIDTRKAIIATLIHHTMPSAQSLLDVGCAAGGLAQTASREGLEHYVGVDISEYAIKKARKQLLEGKKLSSARFYTCDLCDFTPENNSQFDVIVFNEVLYYLDVKEAVVQLERYSNWLRPGGVFCISMKDDPKSHVIYQAISRRFQHVNSILFQASPPYQGVRYRIAVNEEFPTFVVGVFVPWRAGEHKTVEHRFAQSRHDPSSEELLEKKGS